LRARRLLRWRRGSGYFVTFAARACPAYADIYANRRRNDIVEGLEDLGPSSQYGSSGVSVNPRYEDAGVQVGCEPLAGWQFTLGSGYRSRAVSGVWGSLSNVTGAYSTSIVTQDSTPLLDPEGQPTGARLAGATTIELTWAQRERASRASQLWTQGGTPNDPVLAQRFGSSTSPEYGFGALRCATDNGNADNVEFVSSRRA
jgi:YD repeat-containing protein